MRVIETKKGSISGIDMEGYTIFQGIPYAKPPVGSLRYRAPQGAEAFEGVYAADRFRCKCVQDDTTSGPYLKEFYANPEFSAESGEDCLYLNIWAPTGSEGKKLPIAFWIHGGAFLGGFGSELEFDGAAYCQQEVILVTINYRCNSFGFLAHPWLSAESLEENGRAVSGNYGILDQVAALNWVYDHIEAFGGDPENITVFGQSAGSMSTQTLISTELTGDKIAKAIFQSAGSYDGGLNRDLPLEKAMSIGERFVAKTGAKDLAELRSIDAETLRRLTGEFMGDLIAETGRMELVFIPNIDGYLLKEGYNDLIDHNRIKDIPYMLGSTKDDILVTPEMVAADEKSSLYKGCIVYSQKMEDLQQRPSHVYYFSRNLPGEGEDGFVNQAFHSCELWYMFGTLDRCWRPMEEHDYQLSKTMLDYWTNFMKTGNPNGEGLAEWKPCTKQDPVVFEFS